MDANLNQQSETEIVAKFKQQAGINDLNITTMQQLDDYMENTVHPKLNKYIEENDSNSQPDENQFLDGKLDNISPDSLEFMLRTRKLVKTTNNVQLIRTAKNNDIPLGYLLTFLEYEELLSPDYTATEFTKNLNNLVPILVKMWKVGLRTIPEFTTGTRQGKKIYGYYWSNVKYEQTKQGRVPLPQISKYPDSVSVGYALDKDFAKNLETAYTSLLSKIT